MVILSVCINALAQNKTNSKQFSESFMQDSCSFETTGRNTYFILEPGFQLVFEGTDAKGKADFNPSILFKTSISLLDPRLTSVSNFPFSKKLMPIPAIASMLNLPITICYFTAAGMPM